MVLVFVSQSFYLSVLAFYAGCTGCYTRELEENVNFILFLFNPRQDQEWHLLQFTKALFLCVDLLGSQQRDHCRTSRDLVMFPFFLLAYLTCDVEGRVTKRSVSPALESQGTSFIWKEFPESHCLLLH